MYSKVIVRSGINIPPEDQINEAIEELGVGWYIIQANTTPTVFGIEPKSGTPPFHHCIYVTTVVLHKN